MKIAHPNKANRHRLTGPRWRRARQIREEGADRIPRFRWTNYSERKVRSRSFPCLTSRLIFPLANCSFQVRKWKIMKRGDNNKELNRGRKKKKKERVIIINDWFLKMDPCTNSLPMCWKPMLLIDPMSVMYVFYYYLFYLFLFFTFDFHFNLMQVSFFRFISLND